MTVSQRCLVFCVFAPSRWAGPSRGFAPFIRLALQAWRVIVCLGLLHLVFPSGRNGLGFCCGVARLLYETLLPSVFAGGAIVSRLASFPHLCPGLISTPLVPARMVVRLIWKKKFSVFCLAPVFGRDGLVFYRGIALCVL